MLLMYSVRLHAEQIEHSAVGDLPDLLQISELVREGEEKCITASFELSSIDWEGEIGGRLLRHEQRRIAQWWESFHETSWVDNSPEGGPVQPIRMVWCDRDTTILEIPGSATRQRGWKTATHFQPFAVLLETLGFDGTLSEFLAGDQSCLMPLNCKVIGVGERDGFHTVIVRGTRQYPGSRLRREIDLALLLNNHCLPYWGCYREVEDEDHRVKNESQVRSLFAFDDTLSLMREIYVTSNADESDPSKTTIRSIQLNGRPCNRREDDVRLSYPNPMIREISRLGSSDDTGNTRRTQTDENLKSTRSPNAMRWIVSNFCILGGVGLLYYIVAIRKSSALRRGSIDSTSGSTIS